MNYRRDILEIRKERRVSVAKLAEITNIPVDRIYKWESGVGNPKADDSKKLQDWLDGKPEKVQESKTSESALDKYTKLLEDNDQFFKEILKTNLTGLAIGQKSILAHLEVGFEKAALKEAGGDKKKAAKIKDDAGKRIVEVLEEALKKGSWVDKPHPGNQQRSS